MFFVIKVVQVLILFCDDGGGDDDDDGHDDNDGIDDNDDNYEQLSSGIVMKLLTMLLMSMTNGKRC